MNKLRQSFKLFRPLGFICIGLVCLWGGVLVVHAADRYVRPPETCANTDLQSPYTSWDTAATNIQWAVNFATNGDTVWVTNGNYRLTNEIFFGTNTLYSTNITLRSVNGRDVTFLNGNGTNNSPCTNRCICVSNNNITIDGFTITNGYATPWGKYNNEGGGILVLNSANILNCIIKNNYAAWYGGGISAVNSSISNCIVVSNTSGYGEGGGIATLNAGGPLTIANCLISQNKNGITIKNSSGGTIRNCVIDHNYRSGSASYSGAGVMCQQNYTIENCTIVSNYWTGTPARGGGIGIRGQGSNIVIRNCIIYSNSATTAGMDWYTNNSTGTVFSSCCSSTTNGMEGSGNITNWPMFVDYSATNYRLAANSPCVNTGTNQDWMTNSCDFDGRIRIRYGTVDMGAYENIHEGMVYKLW